MDADAEMIDGPVAPVELAAQLVELTGRSSGDHLGDRLGDGLRGGPCYCLGDPLGFSAVGSAPLHAPMAATVRDASTAMTM